MNSTLQWRHNVCDGVSSHRRLDRVINRLFRRRAKKTSKLRVTGLSEEDSPVTSEFPAQRASNAKNISSWWRHHVRKLSLFLATSLMIFGPYRKLPTLSLDTPHTMYLLPDTQNCMLRMRRECRERFPRHPGLAILTCITARVWRTCRDTCRDR